MCMRIAVACGARACSTARPALPAAAGALLAAHPGPPCLPALPLPCRYSFPRLHLPPKAIAAAKAAGKTPDTFYCLQASLQKPSSPTLPHLAAPMPLLPPCSLLARLPISQPPIAQPTTLKPKPTPSHQSKVPYRARGIGLN